MCTPMPVVHRHVHISSLESAAAPLRPSSLILGQQQERFALRTSDVRKSAGRQYSVASRYFVAVENE